MTCVAALAAHDGSPVFAPWGRSWAEWDEPSHYASESFEADAIQSSSHGD